MPSEEYAKHPVLVMRISHHEECQIDSIREQYGISTRQIFEILSNAGCQGGTITATVKLSKAKGGGTKEVKIPCNILSKKKT
jgi:hypothetical protein